MKVIVINCLYDRTILYYGDGKIYKYWKINKMIKSLPGIVKLDSGRLLLTCF